MGIHTTLKDFLYILVEFSILFFEFIGVVIMVWTGLKGLIRFVHKNKYVKLTLLRGMGLGLELLLCGEILKSILIVDIRELIVITGLALLRAALSLLVHWEIKNEEAEYKLTEKKKTPSSEI